MHLTTNCSIYYYFTHTISVVRPGVHLVKAEVSELVILAEYYVHYKFDATLKVDCCRYNISTLEFSVDSPHSYMKYHYHPLL